MKIERKKFTTTLQEHLVKKLKILAIEKGVNVNDLIEEAVQVYLKKFDKKASK